MNKTEFPGANVVAFTFAIVRHGALGLVPGFESLPVTESTKYVPDG
jgi:hypothetical protein